MRRYQRFMRFGAIAFALCVVAHTSPVLAFDLFSWRDHMMAEEKKGLNTWLDYYAMDSAVEAEREEACKRVIPREDAQEGFLQPLLERSILRPEDPAIETLRKKYVAWQRLTTFGSMPCDLREITKSHDGRQLDLVKLDQIKLKAVLRELRSHAR
jgi:hypothetical protein